MSIVKHFYSIQRCGVSSIAMRHNIKCYKYLKFMKKILFGVDYSGSGRGAALLFDNG